MCGTALPAVPGPAPASAGLPSHEVAAAAFTAVASASAVAAASLETTPAAVGRPRIVAGGVSGIGAVAPLGAVTGTARERVLVVRAGRTGTVGSAVTAASVARSPVRLLSLLS